LEIVTAAAELHDLATQWDELWRRDPNATPFQSPHWLLPWWEHFGGGELTVALSRAGGHLEWLLPAYVLREEDESLGLLLGTGVSDYLDALGNSSSLAPLTEADCQLWDLQQLRPFSPLLAAPLPPSWSETVEEHDRSLLLSLGERKRSTHFEKRLRYCGRALARRGKVSWETAGPASLDAMMTALFSLHAARWKQRGLPGVLADEVVQSFHRQVARRMLEAGALRLYALRLEAHIVSVFYGFAHHGTVYYYLGGYEPALEKLSVGMLTIAHAVEEAELEAAHTFDFLRGAEDYKYAWGARDRVNRRRQLLRGRET
jgi:CelD/BcsL family acetyltransferase involved in cellulose biosynthesis